MIILEGQRRGVAHVCLSGDETQVASAERGATQAAVWSLDSESIVQTCRGERRLVGIAFSGDGDVLRGTGTYPKWDLAWRISDGRFAINTPGDYEMDELCRGRSLDVRRYGSGSKQRLVIHGDHWEKGRTRFGMEWGEVRRVGPDWVVGPHADTGWPDAVVVRPANPADPGGDRLEPLDRDVGRCWSVAISDDRRSVALGFASGLVYVHDFITDTEIARWNWEIGSVKALAFSPGGGKSVAGGASGIAVWDVRPSEIVPPVERDLLAAVADGEPNAVAVHSDYLEEQGVPRWDRYDWATTDPLARHARAILRGSAT